MIEFKILKIIVSEEFQMMFFKLAFKNQAIFLSFV